MRISDWSSDVCSSDLPAYLPQSQRDQGYALLCSATPLSDLTIEIDELPPLSDPIAFPAMVKAIEFLAPDVAKVTLRLPLHENLKITAGQFIDLTLANGVRRSYSIANPPKLSNMVDVERSEEHTSELQSLMRISYPV